MRLVHFSMRGCSLKLDSLGRKRSSRASLTEGNNPCKADVYQQRRLLLMGEKPDELDRAFIAPFDETDFLWTSELFVARQPLYRIPERPRGERSEFHGVIALDALLGPELQAQLRIVAGFRYSPVESEKFLGADEDLVQVEQGSWQTCLAQNCLQRKAQFFELSR
jgi:hypothetical protein